MNRLIVARVRRPLYRYHSRYTRAGLGRRLGSSQGVRFTFSSRVVGYVSYRL